MKRQSKHQADDYSYLGPLVMPWHVCSGHFLKYPAVRAWICTVETGSRACRWMKQGDDTGGGKKKSHPIHRESRKECGNSNVFTGTQAKTQHASVSF